LKANRQNKVRNLRNKTRKSFLRTVLKKTLEILTGKKKEEAPIAFNNASSALDKAAKSGIIHKNAAARRKSRLAKKIAKLG
jgi:small subunit ribosomal protein S20